MSRHVSNRNFVRPSNPSYLNRRQAVSHKHRGAPRRQLPQRRHDATLRRRVEGRRGLIANQQRWFPAGRQSVEHSD